MILEACSRFATVRSIRDVEILQNRSNSRSEFPQRPRERLALTEEFINKVRGMLPPQPWKPGLHRKMSAKLGCDTATFFAAVERLIEDGVLYRQKDGVLYNEEGNVVAFDPERVHPETLKLR